MNSFGQNVCQLLHASVSRSIWYLLKQVVWRKPPRCSPRLIQQSDRFLVGAEGHEFSLCGSPISFQSKAAQATLTLGHSLQRHRLNLVVYTRTVKHFKPGLDNAMYGFFGSQHCFREQTRRVAGPATSPFEGRCPESARHRPCRWRLTLAEHRDKNLLVLPTSV